MTQTFSPCSFFCAETLDLSRNQFWGHLDPQIIGGLRRLKTLNIESNRFTGTLPSSLVLLQDLEFINLARNNDLSGRLMEIAASAPWSKMKHLIAVYTSISGHIPEDVDKLSNLITLQLGATALTGLIPNSLTTLLNLQELTIGSRTMRNATFPSSIGKLINLGKEMDRLRLRTFDRKRFVWICCCCYSCDLIVEHLCQLSLVDLGLISSFQGTIPTEIGLLTNLKVRDGT